MPRRGFLGRTPDHERAAAARAVLDAVYAAEIRGLAALYGSREPQGRATGDIAQAARAATFGAMDTLIVDLDGVVPGTVNEDDGTVTFAVAARRPDIPGGGDLAAILRYPI